MKNYVLATVKRDGRIIRKRVFRDENIMRRYYGNIFDLGHQTKDGFEALSSLNTFLTYEHIVLIEAGDC